LEYISAKSFYKENLMPTLEQEEIALLKGRVSRLEARLEFIYKHLGVTFVEDTRPTDDPKVIAALKANNLMEAIKFYRMATNASMEEAKSAVEEMRARLGI
jgi:ribosomal protein L7/L12